MLKKKRLAAKLLVLVMVVVSIINNIQIVKAENNSLRKVYDNGTCRIDYTIDSVWDGAYNVSVTIQNLSDETIDNWHMELLLNDKITNIWNAYVYDSLDDVYIIKNSVWNQDIKEGATVNFGFTVAADKVNIPEKAVVITKRDIVDKKDYKFDYEVTSEWDGGYTAQIIISNKKSSVIEDWIIEFDSDISIDEIYGGVILEHKGNHYIVKNADYNQNILSGQNVNIGIKGSGHSNSISEDSVIMYNYPPCKAGSFDDVISEDPSTDNDNDGIINSLEDSIGTDKNNPDTDGDGISDYHELYNVGTNPKKSDTDGNGINDYEDDCDKDGLSNGKEILLNTDPQSADSDCDGLNDYDEINVYKTNPLVRDTDADGAIDGWEICNGYDPLIYNKSFILSAEYGSINKANQVVAKVKLEATDVDVNSLRIERVNTYDNPFISPSIAGYLGNAYDFSIQGKFDAAELTFEYDTDLGKLSDDFQPRIYYFNEKEQKFEELPEQRVEEGRVTAVTNHFSTYILLNKKDFEEVWNKEIRPEISEGNHEKLNVVFVMDCSDSMYINDKHETSKLAIQSFVDVLHKNDRAALVTFTSGANIRCFLTTDKDVVRESLQYTAEDGYKTAIYRGIETALGIYDRMKVDGRKIMIVLTDGYDEPSRKYDEYYANLVAKAKRNNIAIYTIGIETIDEELLKKISSETNGAYYYASKNPEILEGMDKIKNEYGTKGIDSNNDGISDYYTELIRKGDIVISNGSDQLAGIDLNYNSEGVLSSDYDGDGLANGEEIEIVNDGNYIYIKMRSNPLLAHSDGDGVNDGEEVKRGSDPMHYSYYSDAVNYLMDDKFYNYVNVANELKNNPAINGLNEYSAAIYGVWRKEEIYEDVLVEYYCNYAAGSDTLKSQELIETKRLWIDVLNQYLQNYKNITKDFKEHINDDVANPYNTVKKINSLISIVNGAKSVQDIDDTFYNRVSELIIYMNKLSEDATEIRFEVNGNKYIKKYFDKDVVRLLTEKGIKGMDKVTNAIPFIGYGADVMGTIADTANIHANQKVFNENLDALNYIIEHDSDNTACRAAKDIRDQLIGEYAGLVWNLVNSTAELGGSIVIRKISECNIYVAAVVTVRDLINVTAGVSEDIRQEYRMMSYYALGNAYSNMLKPLTAKGNGYGYYEEAADENISLYTRSLTNLAQIRILGEQEYYYFIKNDGLFAAFFDFIKGIEEYRDNVNYSINNILSRVDKLNLAISEKNISVG